MYSFSCSLVLDTFCHLSHSSTYYSVIGSDHDDEVDEEIEEFRRRLESLGGPISPQPMRARVTLSPTLLGLNS